ncbi:MAG TPA: hypothetical protein VFA67_15875 [Candidatus Sulfotelmatobacter sp.]|nr:hypothetical protein [Candidatus Sulfotelmatobacter sp.]
MRTRILVSATIGLAAGTFCWFLMKHFHQGAADLGWAIHLGQRLLAHQNPYDTPFEQYPLTAAVFGLPFLRLQGEVAAGIFWGLSSGLLAFGLTRNGYTRLLIFLAYPYWAGILAVQWSPLIAASAFFPLLLPATMAKPQVGLPVFLTRFSRRGLWACLAVAVASLIVMPSWPLEWWKQAGNYQHFFPLMVLPGPILLAAMLRYRDRDAQLLLLSALMPQRWFFDSFTLWLIPKSRREIVWTAFFSWGAGIWRWSHIPHTFTQVGRWTVIFLYLPMLAVVLLRGIARRKQGAPGGESQSEQRHGNHQSGSHG